MAAHGGMHSVTDSLKDWQCFVHCCCPALLPCPKPAPLPCVSTGEKKAFTLKMTVGVTLAMVGFCMYSHTKLKNRPQLAKAQAAAKADTSKQDIEEGQPLMPDQEQQLTARVHHT